MPERVLSDEEVQKLGLDQPKPERALADAEVSALGLDKPAPKRVPSRTGWRDADAGPTFGDNLAEAERQNEDMWSTLASAAHGPAMAMEGPVAGSWAALKQDAKNLLAGTPLNPEVTPLDAYRKERDRIQDAQKENLERHPWAPIVGSIVASPGSAATLPGRVAMGMGQGAVYGLGSSDADLTKGEFAEAGKDIAKNAGIGGAGALAGEILRLPGKWLANRAQRLSDATHAAELASEQEARQAAAASARGAFGGEVSSGQRILEMAERAASDPRADLSLRASALQTLNSPEGTALLNQVLRSNLGRFGDAAGRIQNAQTAMTDAMAQNDPQLIQQAASAAANAKLNDLGGVTSRLAELAKRNVPPALGAAIGGAPGMAAGALVSGAMGRPGTIMSNMMKSPSMYRPLVGGAAISQGAGGAMSRMTTPLAEYFGFLDEEKQQ